MHTRMTLAAVAVAFGLAITSWGPVRASNDLVVRLRGRDVTLRLDGPPRGRPLLILSGDGGWVHLAPHVFAGLASTGARVAGFDARAYLETFTDAPGLAPSDVSADIRAIVDAFGTTPRKPVLIGVSEGAGLAVLAASDRGVRDCIGGIVTLGLPEMNELGWRWRDALIYLTHGVPREPLFRASEALPRAASVPLALIYSSHDEFASAEEQRRLIGAAPAPSRSWTIEAADHRFSDNLPALDARLAEALAWIDRVGG